VVSYIKNIIKNVFLISEKINQINTVPLYFLLILTFIFLSPLSAINIDKISIINILLLIIRYLLYSKIILMRSKWRLFSFKFVKEVSWRKLFKNPLNLILIFLYANSSSNGFIKILQLYSSENYLIQNLLLFIIIFITALLYFEFGFFVFMLLNSNKVKKIVRNKVREDIRVNLDFRKLLNKGLMALTLIISILFAINLSEQINDILLGNITNLDSRWLLANSIITCFSFYYFIKFLNKECFKYFNVPEDIILKNNISLFLTLILFIMAVYYSKYIAIILTYAPPKFFYYTLSYIYSSLSPIIPNGNELLSQYYPILFQTTDDTVKGMYITLLIILPFLIYLLYLKMKYPSKINTILLKKLNETSSPTRQTEVNKTIKKIFSNNKNVKYFLRIQIFFNIIIPFIYSLILTYFLVKSATFNDNSFIFFTINSYWIFFGMVSIMYPLARISQEIQKIHKYKISDYINIKLFKIYLVDMSVYLSIGTSLLITIGAMNAFKILENYGKIIVLQEYQIINLMILLYVSSYFLLHLSRKFEETISEELEKQK